MTPPYYESPVACKPVSYYNDDPRDDSRRARPGGQDGHEGLRRLGEDINRNSQSSRSRQGEPANGNRVANQAGLEALGSSPRPGGGGRGAEPPRRGQEGAGGSQPPSRRNRRKQAIRRRRIIVGLTATAVLLVAIFGGGYLYAQFRFGQIKKLNVAALQAATGGPFNVLVIGSDSRVGLTKAEQADAGNTAQVQGQRSDVDMVWHVDPAKKQISVLSIPRDTVVNMGPLASQVGTYNRINAAYGYGPNDLVQIIQNNFGIPINHVVQVGFGGFVGAVDALGGVKMNFPFRARDAYSGLSIPHRGCQLLNGLQALSVARSRHYYYFDHGQWNYDGLSDLSRIKRQDAFLKALIDSAKSKYNPLTLNAFIGSLPQGIEIDSKFSLNELIGLAVTFHNFNPSDLISFTLPWSLPQTAVGSLGSVLLVDQPAAQQMLYQIFGNELTMPTSPPPNANLTPNPPPSLTGTTGTSGSSGSNSSSSSAGSSTISSSPPSASTSKSTTTTIPADANTADYWDPTPC